MIRVLSVGFAERSLLKGFTGAVTDLAFAHLDSSLLGCVDEAGNLMVWQLTCTGSKILYPDIWEKLIRIVWEVHVCVCRMLLLIIALFISSYFCLCFWCK